MTIRSTSLLFILFMAFPLHSNATESSGATFALIIGVNKSIDPDLQDLHYADDDAARYFELFRSLGARTYLLTNPDKNTELLNHQAAA